MLFKKMLCSLSIALFCSSVFAAPHREVAADVINIKAPLVDRQAVKNNSAEVFMDIQNTGQQVHQIIAAFSPAAQLAQLHNSSTQPLNNITITPKQDKDLHYGGLHVMLVNLREPLKQNMIVPIAIIYNDGSWTDVYAKVS